MKGNRTNRRGKGKNPTRTETVTVCLTPEMKERVQKAADADTRTFSNWFEVAIAKAVKKEFERKR